MRRLVVVGAVGGLLLAGAISFNAATAPDAVAADEDSATAVELVDLVLDRLINAGVVTEEKAAEIRERVLASARFQRFAESGVPENFDEGRFEERLDRRITRAQQFREKSGDVDKEQLRKKFAARKNHSKGGGILREQLADVPREDIRSAVENGTLSELIDAGAVVGSITSQAEARLAKAVEAGRLTQAGADAKLAELESKLAPVASGETDLSELLKRDMKRNHKRNSGTEEGKNA